MAFTVQSFTATLDSRQIKCFAVEEKQALRDDRHEAWVTAVSAFHSATAAETVACFARVSNRAGKETLSAVAKERGRVFLGFAHRFMLLPILNRDDRAERLALMRQWKRFVGPEVREEWSAYLQREDAA